MRTHQLRATFARCLLHDRQRMARARHGDARLRQRLLRRLKPALSAAECRTCGCGT